MNDIEEAIRTQKPERPPAAPAPAKKGAAGKKDQKK
jgi:ribosomal protein L12E/L44/L45/RPP1/RPP2